MQESGPYDVEKPLIDDPSDRMLRQFAGLCILFFGAIALREEFTRHRPIVAIIVAGLGVGTGAVGLVAPRLIKPVFIGWMTAAYPIGWVVSRVVLGTIFFVVFTPIGFVFRVIGRDALALKRPQQPGSYWRSKPAAEKKQYLHQY